MNRCQEKFCASCSKCHYTKTCSQARTCKSDKSGNEIMLPFNVIQYLPDDYETCWECGYDHEYEPDYARRYHLAHMECNPRE